LAASYTQQSSKNNEGLISNPVASSGVKSSQNSTITDGATGIYIIYLR